MIRKIYYNSKKMHYNAFSFNAFFIDKEFFQNLLYESTLKTQKMNLKPVMAWVM